jgi:hypothetical protein
MVSTDYCSGTPLLPTIPFPIRNESKWSWLIVACLGTRWGGGTKADVGRQRPPWLKSASGTHFVLVFWVLFYVVNTITFVAENRLRSILLMIFFQFLPCSLVAHSTLANVLMPWSWGWGTVAAAAGRRRSPWLWSVLFMLSHQKHASVLIPTWRRAVK